MNSVKWKKHISIINNLSVLHNTYVIDKSTYD